MDAELKAQWIAALRSGRYIQGRQYLRPTNDSYCCLGVLCDLVNPSEWVRDATGHYRFHGLRSFLPSDVAQLPSDADGVLARMNDGGVNFSEIATYISENL